MNRRLILTALAAASVAAVTGCAGPYTVSADVSSYGAWPADRKPGTYAFDRLPSQQQSEEAVKRQTTLEDAARGSRPSAVAQALQDLLTTPWPAREGVGIASADVVSCNSPPGGIAALHVAATIYGDLLPLVKVGQHDQERHA